ncbi:MAG: hypothetical protein ACK41T_03815 [Pseudobdellovibrio sp.]
MKNLLIASLFIATTSLSTFAFAEETTMEKAENAANKTADSVKKTYRGAKDKVCEMINGKMECVAKKIKHGAQNAADSTETKAKELKNKVDSN